VRDIEIDLGRPSPMARREAIGADRLIEQLRHLVEAANHSGGGFLDQQAFTVTTSQGVGSRRRRATALGVGAVVAVAAFVGAVHVVNRRGHARALGAYPTVTTIASSAALGAYASPIPATPKISQVRPAGQISATSSAIRIDASTNATRSGVIHYEVWRRNTTDKSASWQVIDNIPTDLVAAHGFVYIDSNEHAGRVYAFRVVAVSSTERSGYHQILTSPER
jgi:hypothetical protein